MIAHLKGTLLSKKPNQVIVDVQGVGYEVNISLSTYQAVGAEGEPVALQIYTYVREDAILLYGFKTSQEKELFLNLIAVTGVGPKLGIAVLSGATAEELINAIRTGDLNRLVAIPGVGRKTAERIVLELREKMLKLAAAADMPEPILLLEKAQMKEDLISALVNLGYPRSAVEKAIGAILADRTQAPDFEAILKRALKVLTG